MSAGRSPRRSPAAVAIPLVALGLLVACGSSAPRASERAAEVAAVRSPAPAATLASVPSPAATAASATATTTALPLGSVPPHVAHLCALIARVRGDVDALDAAVLIEDEVER